MAGSAGACMTCPWLQMVRPLALPIAADRGLTELLSVDATVQCAREDMKPPVSVNMNRGQCRNPYGLQHVALAILQLECGVLN